MGSALPLFDHANTQKLEAEREVLRKRIQLLPPYSHKRVQLTSRLCELTSKAIARGVHSHG